MKYLFLLLVITTGILFFHPTLAQENDSVQTQTGQLGKNTDTVDKSVILLSKEREKPFSIMNLFRGLLGMAALIFIGFVFSRDRRNIPWRTVFSGLAIQITLAIGILYIPFIRVIFEFFGKVFVKILDFTKVGTEFLLGGLIDVDTYGVIFLFQVLPTIIFFSALMSLFFYWGIIQKIVWALAWVFTKT